MACDDGNNENHRMYVLYNDSNNPLLRKSWKKYDKPVFSSTEKIIGPGHCSFIIKKQRNNIEKYMIFHSFNDKNNLALTNVNARYIKINFNDNMEINNE